MPGGRAEPVREITARAAFCGLVSAPASATPLQASLTLLLLEGVPDVLASILRLLADLSCSAAEPLSLSLRFKIWIAGGAAGLRLGPALAHLESVPEFVKETHAILLLEFVISGFHYPPLAKYASQRRLSDR
jgi:hypothetical protein